MGNLQNCTDNCFAWFKGYNQLTTKLRQQYRHRYKQTIFYRICMNFVQELRYRNITLDNNYHMLDLKGSLIESEHYEEDSVIHIDDTDWHKKLSHSSEDNDEKQYGNKLPQRLASLNDYEKKQLISDLIKKSYIFLDISDIFSEQQETHSYETQIKNKIFQNDESIITESFISNMDTLADSLKKFDIQTMHKLETYVNMCEKIKKAFQSEENQTYFSKFLLQLKAKIIQSYNSFEKKNIEQLFRNTRILINILEITVDILFDLHIYVYDSIANSVLNKNSVTVSVTSQMLHEQQTNSVRFLNDTNLYTLVSCILFEDKNFHNFYEQALIQKFKNQLNEYKQLSIVTDQNMVGVVLGHDQVISNYFQPTIVSLFNNNLDNMAYFQKTIKIFNKLHIKLEPVLKLKLLAELQKQFIKDTKKLCEIKNIQMIYDREISQYMANWLLNRDKNIGEKNIVSIILAYAFVHNAYRLGAKGSTILSFVQKVEKILKWSIPTAE